MRLMIFVLLLIQLNNLKNIKTAIILAGGKGTRLKVVVSDVPKPMAPIYNRPFLEYLMDYWIDQGVSRFILSVGHLNEVITNHFGNSYRSAQIEYVFENSPLGTGGAFLLASKDLSEPFLLLNGDTFFEVELNDLFSFHNNNNSDWTLSLFRSNDLKRYMGVQLSDTGKIIKLKSKTKNNDLLVNGGVYLINPSVIHKLNLQEGVKISLEDHLLPSFHSIGGALFGNEYTGKFIDIGVPDDYSRAYKILDK
jgi:D-glycero-alpha-D-manno-heptose 1-phosphate guanylyltransferase